MCKHSRIMYSSFPYTAKKRPNMSSQMLKRVGLWESQTNITPSPRTSTPITSSQVEEQKPVQGATGGEVKRFPFQPKTITPQVMAAHPASVYLNVSLPSAFLQGRSERSRSDASWQTPSRPGTTLAPRTPSFDEGNKRSSLDEARFQGSLKPLEELAHKASSLPRGVKVGTETPSTQAPESK